MTRLPTFLHSASVLRRTIPIRGVGPRLFLEAMEGQPRGFSGRGEAWVAWGGALQDLRIERESGGGGLSRSVEELRRELERLGGGLAGSPEEGSSPRLFGGFAFGSGAAGGEGSTDPCWEGFPSARFVLPEFLLEQAEGEQNLTLQWWAEGNPERDAPAEVDSRLQALAHRLEDQARREDAGSPEVRSTGGIDLRAIHSGDPGAQWRGAVAEILRRIRKGELEKAVLARILDVELSRPVGVPEVLERLVKDNRLAHVFLFEPQPGRALMGAAPEVLAELQGGRFSATAVAGSISRGADPEADRRLALQLQASEKDRAEHRHTVEVMREAVGPLVQTLEVDESPGVLTLSRIQHLETRFEGIPCPGVDVLSMVEVLHPTPAVCGRPRDRALDLIRECEPFDRGWYAGPVGWMDTAGQGHFVPALRSAVGKGGRWRLFAGAGIVEGSDPLLEWEETGLKFQPALRALGISAEEG